MLDQIAEFIGKIARPVAILSTAFAAAWATIVIAGKVENGNDGAIFAGAYFLGLGTLYVGKAVEVFRNNRNAADVAIARATGNAPGPQSVVVENTPEDPVQTKEATP